LSVIEESEQPYQQSLFYNTLGDLYLSVRDMDQSEHYIMRAKKLAQKSQNYFAVASNLNHMGNFYAAQNKFQKANKCYSQALETLASIDESENLFALQSKLFINKVHALLEWYSKDNYKKDITETLNCEFTLLDYLNDSYSKAFDMIALSIHLQQISQKFGVNYRSTCNDLLSFAIQLATELNHDRLLSFSYGCMGLLKQSENLPGEAKHNFRKAVTYSQYHHPDIYYLWQWQIGRILYQEDKTEQAAIAYSLDSCLDYLEILKKFTLF